MITKTQAGIEDLYHLPSHVKAELVNGEIVLMSPTGGAPNYAACEILVRLRDYAQRAKTGRAVGDNAGFRVRLPHRESFSPDVAFYIGPKPGMKFYEGAPIFAVEVRSESDYGEAAEAAMAQKRADYFAAGSLIVWDVDLLSEIPIRAYSADALDHPRLFRRGEVADAEPVLPGSRFPVDSLFDPEETLN